MISLENAKKLSIIICNENNSLKSIHYNYSYEFTINEKYLNSFLLYLGLFEGIFNHYQQIIVLFILFKENYFEELDLLKKLILNIKTNDIFKDIFSENFFYLCNLILKNENFNILENLTSNDILKIEINENLIFDFEIQIKNKKISSILTIKENNEFNNKNLSDIDLLIEIFTSNQIYENFSNGFLYLIPNITPITTNELISNSISSVNPLFISDNSPKCMLYESFEQILEKSLNEKLKNREILFILDNLEKKSGDYSILFNNEENILKFITINPTAATKIFNYLKNIDLNILEIFYKLPITRHISAVLSSIILTGKFPPQFVETLISNYIEKIKNCLKKEIKQNYISSFCEMILVLYDNNVNFSDLVLSDLTDFCQEYSYLEIEEFQELSSIILNT